MARPLVIVESPAKAKTIAKFLGNTYDVRASVGHVADLPSKGLQIDVDDATAQGSYSNLVLINHNDNEFVLDFAYLQPSAPRARVRARMASSVGICVRCGTSRTRRAMDCNVCRSLIAC